MEALAVKQTLGRYGLYGVIATGGMATVHYARSFGTAGFARTVAIKRLHPHLARDPEFVSMFLDEAHIVSRINHPNVVNTLDIVNEADELFLVMEYVHGESLSRLVRALRLENGLVPPHIAASVMCGALEGLHAAHEARSDQGEPLGIVHRDVSPQNILVGVDGAARVLDFGVAKANSRLAQTSDGSVKGKLAYMSPEQVGRGIVDRRADVFAAAVVLWEILTGKRLFQADDPAAVVASIMTAPIDAPSALRPELPRAIDEVVFRGLAREPEERFQTAREMAIAIEAAMPVASARQVGAWVEQCGWQSLEVRAEQLAKIEAESSNPALRVAPVASAPGGALSIGTPPSSDPRIASGMHVAAGVAPMPQPPASYPGVPPDGSGVSGVGSSRVALAPPSRGGAVAAIAIGVIVALVAVAAAVVVGWRMRGASTSDARSTASAATAAAPTDETPITPVPAKPTGAPAVAPATASMAISAPETAASTGAAAAVSPAATSKGHRPQPKVVKPPPPPPDPGGGCANPFVLGPDGIRRPKPECFR